MLIKTHNDGFIHPVSSEITPAGRLPAAARPDPADGRRRRRCGPGRAGPGARRWRRRVAKPGKLAALPGAKSGGGRCGDHGKGHRLQGRQHLQQLLRIRHRQDRSGQERPHPEDHALDGGGRRPGQEAGQLRARRPAQAQRPGRAHLPPALRRRLVDGDSLGRLFAGGADQEGRAAGQRQVRRVRHPGRSQDHAFCRLARAGLALCRGPAPGRGHASADPADLRHVRRGAAQPERRAGAPGGAVEVRLQERQEHRQDPLHRQGAAHRLEQGAPPTNTASIPT